MVYTRIWTPHPSLCWCSRVREKIPSGQEKTRQPPPCGCRPMPKQALHLPLCFNGSFRTNPSLSWLDWTYLTTPKIPTPAQLFSALCLNLEARLGQATMEPLTPSVSSPQQPLGQQLSMAVFGWWPSSPLCKSGLKNISSGSRNDSSISLSSSSSVLSRQQALLWPHLYPLLQSLQQSPLRLKKRRRA